MTERQQPTIGDALARGLDGRTVLVCGASSGLGAHFARVYARYGAHVIATARRRDRLDKLVAEIGEAGGWASAFEMDVADKASIARCFADIAAAGRVPDVLVNNAGIAARELALNLADDDWDATVDTNLSGAFRVAKATASAMIAAGKGGSIINTSSILGLRVSAGVAPYAASKAALVQLTRALALEWARHGIRVNAVAPGYYDTDISGDFLATEHGQAMVKRIPQRRIGRLQDLDGVMLLLASDASSYMTGTVIPVDGGHLVSAL